ncbi:MAG: protein kinase [Labilithrix sp.]|nr:protein kinase [Labilithrix sp.]
MADVLPSEELVDEPSDFGSLQPGTRLGRYELLVPIARGGMARVWAARLHGQRGFQKLVAIKTILPHLAEEPEFERMFLDEARIASGVHHPNVCEIYELGEEKKTLYLAMEWVSGDSLARVLRASGKTEPLDPRVVARVVADACAGLHAAHELTDDDGRALGVVHRDLSPHNILLTADGTAKVADFGVAKALGQLHEATSAGQLKGKIAYMAPEQVTGGAIDRRSDVFSLGCVLYEATTGQRPFRGDGDHQVMHAVLKGEYPAPSSLLRGYPPELERIVQRALSPQAILRFPTAERMRFALEEYVARGQLVTQSNVAQVVRARIGELIERRKERIRQASTAGDGGGWIEPPGMGAMTPSNRDAHRSGVKPSGAHAARPLFTTMQMDRPPPPQAHEGLPPQTPQMGGIPALPSAPGAMPTSSTTIPQASPYAHHHGHTPVSHPGASYPGAGTPPPPPAYPLAQTALMPPTVSMQELSGVPAAPQTASLHPFSMPPVSSQPPDAVMASPMFSPAPPPVGVPASQMPGPFDVPPSHAPAPFDTAPATDPQPAGAGQYAVAIGVGVLLAALIGGGGFFVWRSRHAAPVAESSAPSTPPSAGVATPVPVAVAAGDIEFHLTPPDARLSVDGVELAPDARKVPRPAMGKTATVVVRATDRADTTVQIDFFTTSPMDLSLAPSGAGSPPPVDTAAAIDVAPETPEAPAPKPEAKPVQPAKVEAAPANPDRPVVKPRPQSTGRGSDPLPANPY